MQEAQEKYDSKIYAYLVLAAGFTLTTGTVVYHFVEHFKWLDAYYFSVITLATVGYGDLTPHTDTGKLFTTFYILAGVGIVTTFVSATLRRRASKMHKRMKDKE